MIEPDKYMPDPSTSNQTTTKADGTKADGTPPNVKIFDRPEPKRLSPVLLAIFVIIALTAGFFGYRTFFMNPAKAPSVPSAPTNQTRQSFSQPYSSPYPSLATDTQHPMFGVFLG